MTSSMQYSWHIVVFFEPVGDVLVFVQWEVKKKAQYKQNYYL
jgi:hypothetical protein